MFFWYNSGDLVYSILPVTSQLRTSSRKVVKKYIEPLVKLWNFHNYFCMTISDTFLKGLFDHERLKPATIRTS